MLAKKETELHIPTTRKIIPRLPADINNFLTFIVVNSNTNIEKIAKLTNISIWLSKRIDSSPNSHNAIIISSKKSTVIPPTHPAVLEIEPRASYMLGKRSTTSAMLPVFNRKF
jgi:hypothetical protein